LKIIRFREGKQMKNAQMRAVTVLGGEKLVQDTSPDNRRWMLPRVAWPFQPDSSPDLEAALLKARGRFPRSRGYEFRALNRSEARITAPSRELLEEIVAEHVVGKPSGVPAHVLAGRVAALMRLAVPLPR
jgi:hypothetical protein